MAESILVTGKKISAMELVTNVTGSEKIPTGQPDDLAVTPNQIADHTIARGDLASQEDLSQVEVSLGTQIADLTNDVNSSDNSIRGLIAAEEAARISKDLELGQGLVDEATLRTAADESLQESLSEEVDARIAADDLKVDKEGSVSSVAGRVGDVVLAPSDVLIEGFGSQEDVNKYVPKHFLSAYTYGLGESVVLDDGDIVKSTVAGNTVDPNVDMTGWFNESKFLEDKTKSFLDFGAKGDGIADDSVPIGLAATWSSIYKRKVSGVGRTYKCSNVFFDSNCHLVDAKLINNSDEDLISVLTTTVSSDWLENVVFEGIHIDGKRADARTIKATVTSEDGGRHGFRFRRPCRNIWIIRSSANYCASDGLCVFPDYSGGLFESVQNFNVIDSEFLWNRRHGGSNDRTNGINFTNVKCKYNGLPLAGGSGYPATDGRNGDTFNGNYYGTGWDSEEYDDTTISQNMTFINCDMRGNAQSGLLIISTGGVVAPATPTNIKIIGGHYDKGVYNTDDDAAILITPNGISNLNDIYTNTVIDSVSTSDGITLRNNVNFSVTNTPCTLAVLDRCSGYIDAKVTSYDIALGSSVKFLDGTPVGAINYNRDTGVKTVTEYPITDNMFNDAQSKYQDYRVGTFKFGQIETKVDSATNSTTWTWKTGADVERFRVGRYGVQLHVPDAVPDGELKNQGSVFELVSDTQLRVKVKGVDGVVRSVTLTLA